MGLLDAEAVCAIAIGIPKKGYRVSNNSKPKLRAPTREAATLSLKRREQCMVMRLVYREMGGSE
jgi:hypothetical protein